MQAPAGSCSPPTACTQQQVRTFRQVGAVLQRAGVVGPPKVCFVPAGAEDEQSGEAPRLEQHRPCFASGVQPARRTRRCSKPKLQCALGSGYREAAAGWHAAAGKRGRRGSARRPAGAGGGGGGAAHSNWLLVGRERPGGLEPPFIVRATVPGEGVGA